MIKVVFFIDQEGRVPVMDWIEHLSPKIQDKAETRITALAEYGEFLRRPLAAPLQDGINELRWEYFNINYRILYAFEGKGKAVLLNAFTKKRIVPHTELKKALERFKLFKSNPIRYTYKE